MDIFIIIKSRIDKNNDHVFSYNLVGIEKNKVKFYLQDREYFRITEYEIELRGLYSALKYCFNLNDDSNKRFIIRVKSELISKGYNKWLFKWVMATNYNNGKIKYWHLWEKIHKLRSRYVDVKMVDETELDWYESVNRIYRKDINVVNL